MIYSWERTSERYSFFLVVDGNVQEKERLMRPRIL